MLSAISRLKFLCSYIQKEFERYPFQVVDLGLKQPLIFFALQVIHNRSSSPITDGLKKIFLAEGKIKVFDPLENNND